MPDLSSKLERMKTLRERQGSAVKQVAADEAQLQLFEKQRKELYDRCHEMNVDPQNIKQEISDREVAIESDLQRIEERFDSLQGDEQNGN